MKCQQCAFANPPGMRFCGQCGTALAFRCPKCDAEVPPTFRFCGQCGASLQPATAPPQPAAPSRPASTPAAHRAVAAYTPKHLADKILQSRSAVEGERRQVTVLFADVAGFTSLAERLDPEEVHGIMNRCFEIITGEIHRFEGTVNQYTGDGVMALFGAPIAHEDSPRRAVHAALGIQRAMRDYARALAADRGLTLQLRVGLNTGPVVVGSIGDDLRMDYTAVGDTTNLAARMQQIARPGSVTVSEATHAAVAGFFDTLDLGLRDVKGHTAVRAFEVLRPRGMRSRLDVAAERGLTPLVGRARELNTLLERFADVKAGRGQVVLLAGEAGIGKSRLLLEFRRRLSEAGESMTWLEGQCVSFGRSIPFLPIADQLRRNFGIEEFDGEPEIIAKVEHGMRSMGELEPHIPYVRYLLSVDPGDPAIVTMEPLGRRRKIFDAIRALTLRGTQLRPLVLVYEDLHWVDDSTEEYLKSLMDSVATARLLVALTCRVGYTPPFATRSFQTTVALQSLSPDDTIQIAGSILGTQEFPQAVKRALMEKAEGVPLFIEEVAKTLLDLGILRREDGGLRVVGGLGEVSVPDTIQGIIMARLDRLGDEGKRTVQLASVIGRRFLLRLLDRVAGLTDRLEGLLAELKQLEIVYEQGLLPEPAYVFKHAVIQDVAYNSLLRERRRDLHRRVGEAIEELFADRLAEHYEELAHHFVLGEHWSKAFEYLVRSGDRAKDAYANQVALDSYARALDVAGRATPAPPLARLAEVHQKRARVWLLLTRYPEAIEESRRMVELARACGDRQAEGEGLADIAFAYFATFQSGNVPLAREHAEQALRIAEEIDSPRVRARSLTSLALVDQVDGVLTESDRKFQEALAISERAGFRDIAAQSLVWLGAHAEWRGDFPRAIAISGRTEALASEIHDGLTELIALAFACLAQTALGQYGDALATVRTGLLKARERNNAFIEGRLLNSLGWFHQELGDFARAAELNRESQDLGRRINNPNVEVSAAINIGLDRLRLGEPRQALEFLEETAGRVEKLAFGAHRWRWSIHIAVYLAQALLELDEPGRALLLADQALVQARATTSTKYVGWAHALRGEIALCQGDWPRATEELNAALGLGQQISYGTLVWQSADLLARAFSAGDRPDDARRAAAIAAETIDGIAARAPDAELRRIFLAWRRVEQARETHARLGRG